MENYTTKKNRNKQKIAEQKKQIAFFLRLFRKKKQANMTICGLDKAGKTSVINYLMHGENRATIPTMGVNVNTVNLPKLDINIYDLGG